MPDWISGIAFDIIGSEKVIVRLRLERISCKGGKEVRALKMIAAGQPPHVISVMQQLTVHKTVKGCI